MIVKFVMSDIIITNKIVFFNALMDSMLNM